MVLPAVSISIKIKILVAYSRDNNSVGGKPNGKICTQLTSVT